ncbi:MAG: M24 family metallopeptidase [Rhodospirillales bacterium]|nr:M24 family metallopeptidase [Rhodospirillales bacterium]
MAKMSERLNKPISTKELERRWAAIRAAMEAEGIDVLLMQNNNDHMGGYTKYVTDVPASNGYPFTAVFPRDDAMTIVHQGPFDGDFKVPPEGDGMVRGVKRVLTTPSYESAPYTRDYDPALACKALEPFASATIGLVGTYQMSFAMVDFVKRQFPNATYVEASDMMDQIKVIKSAEEIEFIEGTAAQQDAAMQAVIDQIKPGMKDSDVAAIALHTGHNHGSEQGIYLCQSWQIGKPAAIAPRHNQNRVIKEGDSFNMLVENNGAGGFFTEIGRTIVLGEATQAQHDELAFTLEAQRFTLDLLKPGTPCAEIWDTYNAYMRDNDRDEETRLFCHGQGYDLVERPLIRKDEPMSIQKNMNIVCHPGYMRNGLFSWICDNYIIGDNGPGDSIHKTPQKIFEVG